MTAHDAQRIDLHVHTKYAGRFKPFALQQLEVDESHTEPKDLYERLLARDMSLVTVTDHDSIQGCLEIAHLPYTFISEEVSARFPENGCIIHVLTYGITEAQHDELQRLRGNVYELCEYIRQQDILSVLAHPFSSVNGRLDPDLLRKSLLLFDNVEVYNGQKDHHHASFVRDVIAKVDDRVLEQWAACYDLPVPPRRSWGITAGSDDHSGWTMARAFTTFRGPRTFEGLRAAIVGRNTEVHGLDKNPESYAHTAMLGTINHFRHAQSQQRHIDETRDRKPSFRQVIDLVQSRKLPADLEALPPFLQRLVPAVFETMAEVEQLPGMADAIAKAQTPEFHREVYGLVHGAMLRAFRSCAQQLQRGVQQIDLEALVDEIPTLIRLSMLNMPYYFGFRFFNGERRRGWALYESLELPDPVARPERAAVFCDTLDNVDGVAIGLRRIVHEMREDGREVFLCGAHGDDTIDTTREGAELVRFPTLGNFPLPGYDDYRVGWPSFVEVIRWLTDKEIDLVVTTTPGPVGLIATLAAKALDIPVVGQYHTNVGDFASRILGDATIGRILNGFTGWLYGGMNEVAAPTRATAGKIVEQYDMRPERIRVVRRGVDTQRFHPGHGDPSFWPAQGLRGHNTLLYVGRLSREKNVGFLTDVVRELVDHGADLELAVVGDGPMRAELERSLEGYPVAFTGYLRGEQLAIAYASADLFVFPSTNDTFGNVVMEALASGTPALVTDVGGPSELVAHREAGLVLPAGDAGRWIDAIETLVLDRPRRTIMGRCARRLAEESTFERARAEQWAFYADNIQRFRQDVRARLR